MRRETLKERKTKQEMKKIRHSHLSIVVVFVSRNREEQINNENLKNYVFTRSFVRATESPSRIFGYSSSK